MPDALSRREFLAAFAAVAAANPIACASGRPDPRRLPFKISLAEWSLHRTIRGQQLDHLDFARVTRQEFDLDAVEYVNGFFRDKATDTAYLREMNERAADHGVVQHLIMIDAEGRLGDPDNAKRTQAIENHHKWVAAAKQLGCITIRVNAASEGSWEEQARLAADGLRRLCEYGEQVGINVIVENHGGLSSNGQWLSSVMRLVDHPRCGTLPDFGNFNIGNGETYDKYKGVAELMPFAKAVSAKSHDFDERGEETDKDYRRLLKTVTDAGYHSWVGIEYEGQRLGEREGIAATLRLLKTIQAEMDA
ncbi:MAG: sugar phosphate isomerase/epimerase family protein [Gemmatimonadota bacterium]